MKKVSKHDALLARNRILHERNKAIVDLVRGTPLEEWGNHPEIMEKVQAEGFDIDAAIAWRDATTKDRSP